MERRYVLSYDIIELAHTTNELSKQVINRIATLWYAILKVCCHIRRTWDTYIQTYRAYFLA